MTKLFELLVRFYQSAISPLLGQRCRFHPTCSHYMIEAVKRDGMVKGLFAGMKRIARCNPWCSGGFDPLPANDSKVN